MSDITTKTQAEITQDLSNNMPSGYQTSTGFPIYDFFVAIAMVLKTIWDFIVAVYNNFNIDNLTGDDLVRKCEQDRNIIWKQKQASSGYLTVEGDFSLAVGDQFSTEGDLIFEVLEAIEDTEGTASVHVQCATAGIVGNVPANSIIKMPVTLTGVTSVTNEAAFTNGYDDESWDSLRQRYKDDVAMPITSGNQYHYKKWALECVGVGNARVLPLWDGDNTVKVIIIDANSQPAGSELVGTVQEYIDPEISGIGAGQAPIGAYCTVVSASALNINITANVTYLAGTIKATVDEAIAANIASYLAGIAFKQNYVSYARIGDAILDTAGVEDYNTLLVNSGTANISVSDSQVAVKGTTAFTAV